MTDAKKRKVHTPEFKAFTPRNASRPTFDREYTRHPFYGSRRMVVYLRRAGHCVNRQRVQRLMRQLGLAKGTGAQHQPQAPEAPDPSAASSPSAISTGSGPSAATVPLSGS